MDRELLAAAVVDAGYSVGGAPGPAMPGLVQLGRGKAGIATTAPPTGQSIDLPITGMTCAGCAATITKVLEAVPGVSAAGVNFATRRATVLFDPAKAKREHFVNAVAGAGYGVSDAGGQAEAELREYASTRRRFQIALALSLPVIVIAMTHGVLDFPGSRWLQLILTTPVVLYCGLPFFDGAWKALKRKSGLLRVRRRDRDADPSRTNARGTRPRTHWRCPP